MDHYIDILLLPDAEMRINVLLNKTYAKLHKVLHERGGGDIGISFPKYNILLGNVIRLVGSAHRLEVFESGSWLGGMVGYCKLSVIQEVPSNVSYRNLSRARTKKSDAKLRRLLKRGSINDSEAKRYRQKMFSEGLDQPYIELESSSNGQKYRRYIEFSDLQDSPTVGEFDSFGLSKTATIPWF